MGGVMDPGLLMSAAATPAMIGHKEVRMKECFLRMKGYFYQREIFMRSITRFFLFLLFGLAVQTASLSHAQEEIPGIAASLPEQVTIDIFEDSRYSGAVIVAFEFIGSEGTSTVRFKILKSSLFPQLTTLKTGIGLVTRFVEASVPGDFRVTSRYARRTFMLRTPPLLEAITSQMRFFLARGLAHALSLPYPTQEFPIIYLPTEALPEVLPDGFANLYLEELLKDFADIEFYEECLDVLSGIQGILDDLESSLSSLNLDTFVLVKSINSVIDAVHCFSMAAAANPETPYPSASVGTEFGSMYRVLLEISGELISRGVCIGNSMPIVERLLSMGRSSNHFRNLLHVPLLDIQRALGLSCEGEGFSNCSLI
jgi:hypothetical protein